MALKASLRSRPVIYEIVPPRRDTSRFDTELRGIEDVLEDKRIAAINVPELISRSVSNGQVFYSPSTIPPEDYCMMIKEQKEAIVNIVAPRLGRKEFVNRARTILHDYKIPNVVVVGRERNEDVLPGPGVLEALELLRLERGDDTGLGGICIFDRDSTSSRDYGGGSSRLTEHKRVWLKAEAGCDFVTSQIIFDPKPAIDFLLSYQALCEETGSAPLTVFISLTTVPSPSILSLLETLDVVIPNDVRRRLLGSRDMGRESQAVAAEVFHKIIDSVDEHRITVPIGLQIDQVGVKSGELSLGLLDEAYSSLKAA